MAGASKTAYGTDRRPPATAPGRPRHPMAGAAWLAVVLAGAAAVIRDIERLRAAGLRVVPTIANITDGKWAYQPAHRMLHSPALMARQVAAIAVLRYAKTQIPASKIILGIPLYGYDWSGGHGTAITWLQALRLSRQYHVPPRYDMTAQAPWLRYTDRAGHKHTVWFGNEASSRAKFDLAQGAEDAGTWPALSQVLPTSGSHALSTSKAVP